MQALHVQRPGFYSGVWPSVRSALICLLALVAIFPPPGRAQTTIVLKDLPNVVFSDHSPISLDLLPGLVDNGGFAAIRGFYANLGVSFADPGQLRAFHVMPPIPSPIDGPGLGLLVSFDLNIPRRKQPGIHGVRLTRAGFGVLSTPIEFLDAPGPTDPKTQLGTFVSVFDPLDQTFGGDIDTPVAEPDPTDNGGRVPEGMEIFVTFANGRNRFLAVNNYHEGSVTLIDWTNRSSVTPYAEYRLNELPSDVCPLPPAPATFTHLEGNHNRGLAVATPTMGALANRTLLLVTLNYDPYGVDCDDEIDNSSGTGDGRPDEGSTDYLVILDVTDLDPTMPVPPLSSLFPSSLPTGLLPLGPSIQATLTAVCVGPDRNVAYVVSKNQVLGNSPNEKPHLYAVDLTTSPPSVVFGQAIETLDPSLTSFQASVGHIVAIRNDNLQGVATDRLYIGTTQFAGAPDSGVLVLDIKNTPLNPTFLSLVVLPINSDPDIIWQVFDLVASPVKSDFLGLDLARNIIFGIVRNAKTPSSIPSRGRLLILEDR